MLIEQGTTDYVENIQDKIKRTSEFPSSKTCEISQLRETNPSSSICTKATPREKKNLDDSGFDSSRLPDPVTFQNIFDGKTFSPSSSISSIQRLDSWLTCETTQAHKEIEDDFRPYEQVRPQEDKIFLNLDSTPSLKVNSYTKQGGRRRSRCWSRTSNQFNDTVGNINPLHISEIHGEQQSEEYFLSNPFTLTSSQRAEERPSVASRGTRYKKYLLESGQKSTQPPASLKRVSSFSFSHQSHQSESRDYSQSYSAYNNPTTCIPRAVSQDTFSNQICEQSENKHIRTISVIDDALGTQAEPQLTNHRRRISLKRPHRRRGRSVLGMIKGIFCSGSLTRK